METIILTDHEINKIKAFNFIDKIEIKDNKIFKRHKEQYLILIRDDGKEEILREIELIERYIVSICGNIVDFTYKEKDLIFLEGRLKYYAIPKSFNIYSDFYEWKVKLII